MRTCAPWALTSTVRPNSGDRHGPAVGVKAVHVVARDEALHRIVAAGIVGLPPQHLEQDPGRPADLWRPIMQEAGLGGHNGACWRSARYLQSGSRLWVIAGT